METYEMCKKVIANDKRYETNNMTASKLNVFFVANQLTEEQYKELLAEISE